MNFEKTRAVEKKQLAAEETRHNHHDKEDAKLGQVHALSGVRHG